MGLSSLSVAVEPDGLLFRQVPFRPCRWFPRGKLVPADIVDIDPARIGCPAVLTVDGDFLPVPRRQVYDLVAFARVHRIPLVEREDVWGWLLEPFLDTELSAAEDAHLLGRLAGCGLDAMEVGRIRARVRPRMLALAIATWEWQHFGLFDVLDAMTLMTLPRDYAAFYGEAMAIARRGRTHPLTGERVPAMWLSSYRYWQRADEPASPPDSLAPAPASPPVGPDLEPTLAREDDEPTTS